MWIVIGEGASALHLVKFTRKQGHRTSQRLEAVGHCPFSIACTIYILATIQMYASFIAPASHTIPFDLVS